MSIWFQVKSTIKTSLCLSLLVVAGVAIARPLPDIPQPPAPPQFSVGGGSPAGPAQESTQLQITQLLEWIDGYHEEEQYEQLLNIVLRLDDQINYMSLDELTILRQNLIRLDQRISVELVNGVLTPRIYSIFFLTEITSAQFHLKCRH